MGNTPIGRGCDAAIEPMRRSARPPIALRIAAAGVHLGWQACCDWIGAARSSRCRLDATPHPTDRCRRRDLQSGFRACFDHVEIEAQLNQAYFVVVRCMRTDRERQTMTIYNRHDFQAFSSFCRADVRATALGHCKGRVDKALFFVQHAICAGEGRLHRSCVEERSRNIGYGRFRTCNRKTTVEDLSGKTVYVRKSSSYYEHLLALNELFASQGLKGIELLPADEDLEDEDLLEMVNAGIFPFVIVDDYVARIWAKLFKSITLRKDIVIFDKGAIAGAIRENSPLLKATLNRFLQEKVAENAFANWIVYRYYTNEKMVLRAFALEDIGRFNGLVGFFQRYADQYGFDYLMIAAQDYQESSLSQADRSKSGAVGVMQMKPSTAREPYIAIKGIEDSAERNIEAGNKYLRYLIKRYVNDPDLDPKNQTLLAFAGYNAGPGGLQRFRARAKAMGLNPNIWFGNVENAAAAIVGRETVQYVSNIYKYYIAYTVIRQVENNEKARKAIMQ